MARTWAQLRDNIEQLLQDTSNAVYGIAELAEHKDAVLGKITDSVPYVVPLSFNLETRTGTATSTSSGKLVDATESQFVAGDAGKIVYNKDDHTWATVVTRDSATQLTLSKDIMASGEEYAIFNEACRHKLEINIEDIGDYLYIDKVEFPLGYNPPRYRNFLVDANILRIKYDGTVDDTKDTDAEKEALVYFVKRHKLTELTDTAGAINNVAGYAAGDTSLAIDGLSGTEIIEEGQELTIANTRGIYTVTADLTLAAGGGTVTVFPGLESAVANNDVVTLKASTLTPRLETIFCELAAGYAAISKSYKLLLEANTAITTISTGATAVALSTARIAQAVTYLGSGDDFIEGVNVGEPVGGYAAYAAREVANAMGRLAEGGGSFNKAGFELRISAAARGLEAWGQNKVNRALADLGRLARPNVSRMYSRY